MKFTITDLVWAMVQTPELKTAVSLMKKFRSLFCDKEIYIVGGVPRDIVLGSTISDVDLATNIDFDILKNHFEIRNISKNDSQPVFTIKHNDMWFDIAQFRTDSGDIGRNNNVSTITDNFKADTMRRDLTINSLGMDENGTIFDCQGGIADIDNKVINTVGDPIARFEEDATRILRVCRFSAKLNFTIKDNVKDAIHKMKHILNDRSAISMESISKEIYKAASDGKTLSNFIQILNEFGILDMILPEFAVFNDTDTYKHNKIHHPEGNGTVIGHILECLNVSPFKDPVINLAVLFHDIGKSTTLGEKTGQPTYYGHEMAGVPIVKGIFERLRFAELTAKDKENILDGVRNHMLIHNLDKLNPKTLTRLILNDSWDIVKSVGFCDEASRGEPLFNKVEFNLRIEKAVASTKKLGNNSEDLRKRLKEFVNGNKILEWFPEVNSDKKQIKGFLDKANEFIINKLSNNFIPTEEEIKLVLK